MFITGTQVIPWGITPVTEPPSPLPVTPWAPSPYLPYQQPPQQPYTVPTWPPVTIWGPVDTPVSRPPFEHGSILMPYRPQPGP